MVKCHKEMKTREFIDNFNEAYSLAVNYFEGRDYNVPTCIGTLLHCSKTVGIDADVNVACAIVEKLYDDGFIDR